MSPRARLLPAADQDLLEYVDYIGQNNMEAAVRFYRSVNAAIDRLVDMPKLGRIRETRQEKLAGLRVWQVPGFSNYLIFYRPVDDGIEIIRVLHGAMDVDTVIDPE